MEKQAPISFKTILAITFFSLIALLVIFSDSEKQNNEPIYMLLGLIVAVFAFLVVTGKGKVGFNFFDPSKALIDDSYSHITICHNQNNKQEYHSLAKCFENMDKLLTVVNKRLNRKDCVLEGDTIQLKDSLEKERKARSALMSLLVSQIQQKKHSHKLKNLSEEEQHNFYREIAFNIKGTAASLSWQHHYQTIMSHPHAAKFIAAA